MLYSFLVDDDERDWNYMATPAIGAPLLLPPMNLGLMFSPWCDHASLLFVSLTISTIFRAFSAYTGLCFPLLVLALPISPFLDSSVARHCGRDSTA